MGKDEAKLPDGWIRKESSTRPDRFYFYNIKTGKSQWHSPNEKDKAKSRDECSKNPKSDVQTKNLPAVQHRLKISDKSKDGKFNESMLCAFSFTQRK